MKLNYKYTIVLDEVNKSFVYKRIELINSDDLSDITTKFNQYKNELINNKYDFCTYCEGRTIRLYCLDNYTGEIEEEYDFENLSINKRSEK